MAKQVKLVADAHDVVRRLRQLTDEVAVAFSCGKDSAALFELCLDWFPRVAAFYMYVTPDLSFHEQYLRLWEDRAGDKLVGRKILRLPHWALSTELRASAFRNDLYASKDVPRLRIKDIEVQVAKQTGVMWFAHGQKKADSLERRAMISKDSGIILPSHRAFPLAEWTNRTVTQFLRSRNIPLSPEYAVLGRSYGGALDAEHLIPIRDHFPDDFAKILKRFPLADADIFRVESGMRKSKLREEA